MQLVERIVRVEEELKALKEVQLLLIREMNTCFEAVEKRFFLSSVVYGDRLYFPCPSHNPS